MSVYIDKTRREKVSGSVYFCCAFSGLLVAGQDRRNSITVLLVTLRFFDKTKRH